MPCCGSTAEIGKVVHIEGGERNPDGIEVKCHICGRTHITNDVSFTMFGAMIPTSRLKTLPDANVIAVRDKYMRQRDETLRDYKRRNGK